MVNRFAFLDTKYSDIFKEFLDQAVTFSINEANQNNGKYIASWVVNKANPNENRKFEWDGTALMQDAVHDAGRALGEWNKDAIIPLSEIWGKAADIDFEDIKQLFLSSMQTDNIEVNSMIIPSTLDQGDVISPFLPADCIHTFDNGAKKSPQFGNQYVTQATIYDTGYSVEVKGRVGFFPPIKEDFQNFGTLTITVMPMNVGKWYRPQVFVIFSHGRIISEVRNNPTEVGMEGFMSFFDAEHFMGGFENRIGTRLSYFEESTLNANIGPVSENKYLNNSVLVSSTYGSVMPKYFAEIIKFIADRNQCIMCGFFSNLDPAVVPRFYVNAGINKLMLVSGDRYSLGEIFRFLKTDGVCIPFTYFGASRYERYFEKGTNPGQGFNIVSAASRCLFSVRQKDGRQEDPELRDIMKQLRELQNLIEKLTEVSSRFEVDLQTAQIEYSRVEKERGKVFAKSSEYAKIAEDDLKRIQSNSRLMETIKTRIKESAIEKLSLSYQFWVSYEQFTLDASESEKRIKSLEDEFNKNQQLIYSTNEALDKARGNLLKKQNETKEDATSGSEVASNGALFNNTTRMVETEKGVFLQDVASGYIYREGEDIMTVEESIERQRLLENPEEFAALQHQRTGGMKRATKNRNKRVGHLRKNVDGWMLFHFLKPNPRKRMNARKQSSRTRKRRM